MADHGPVRWLHRLNATRPGARQSTEWEIEHHIAEAADRLVDEGWEASEARREAERRFGDSNRYAQHMTRVEREREAMMTGARVWEVVRSSTRAVARAARRQPGFSLAVVATLALGIGANATMYGIIDRLLLQPPTHVVDHDAVRRVFVERPHFVTGEPMISSSITHPDYLDLEAHAGLESVAAYTTGVEYTVGSGESATRAKVALVSASFFPLLGVQPRIGRFFTEDEARAGAQPTLVISEEYWRGRLGSDPDVLGSTIEIRGLPLEVIGVAPAGFTGVDLAPVDMWAPLEGAHTAIEGESCISSRGCYWMSAVARLASGTTTEAAEAEATALHQAGRSEMIESGRYSEQARVVLGSVIAAQGPEASRESQVARWLLGVSLLVLVIACANVANLLMARGIRRQRELGLRLALGASRGRIVAQVIAESVILAAAGAVAALVLAQWGGAVVRSTLLPGVQFPASFTSGRILAFTAVAALVAGVVSGLAPALQGARADLTVSLGEGARGNASSRSRIRSILTITQAAVSVVLLVGAGLFVQSLNQLRSQDLGLNVDELALAQLEFRSEGMERPETDALYQEAASRLSGLPGVESASATAVPFQWGFSQSLRVPGLDSLPRLTGGGPYFFPVSPGYFETVGVSIVRGRAFDETDGASGALVAVVSETMASSLWPDQDAIGACLLVGNEEDDPGCTIVVGIAEDAARGGYQDEPFMAYYLPTAQHRMALQGLYIRTDGESGTLAEAAALLRTFSPEIRFANVRSLREMLDPQARAWTLGATMFTAFGLLALVLAAIGLYSVLAFDVAQRTRELGIRTALGAEKANLLGRVVVQGSRMAVAGVAIGLAVAWVAAPYSADLLFEVSPREPGVLATVALVLVAIGAVASLVPALRATRVQPMEALRSE